MVAPKPINGQVWTDRAVSGVVAAILTISGFATYQQVYPPRPDPFFGADGHEMRRELELKLNVVEQRIVMRLDKIEAQDTRILEAQNQIWRAIANLPPPQTRQQLTDMEDRIKDLEIWVAGHRQRQSTHTAPLPPR